MSKVKSTSQYVITTFFWGVISRIVSAILQFISVPLLLSYFGRENYGLIALAVSINAYLQLLDLGVNTGAIKYFSEWISLKKYNLLDSVARTSITFYGIIGLINSLALFALAIWGVSLFSLTEEQSLVFQNLLLILAIFSIFNWATSVFNQLLTANEQLAYVQQINIFRNLLVFVVVGFTLYFKLDITLYFLLYTVISSLLVLPFYYKSKKSGLIKTFMPAINWEGFSIIFKYSMAIIAMAIFQMSAVKLRPLILSMFSDEGVGVVADFQILDTLTIFIISIGGMFISIFLPKTSKLLLTNDTKAISEFAYNSTKYTTIICVCLCLPFVICAKELLTIYVGKEYLYLSKWLIIWVLTILAYLYNSPISGLVLSSGKTKMLVYSSAIACIVSLLINIYLCPVLGVGSAVVGYGVYILIQMSFYYFYFNNRVLKLSSFLVFKSFIVPTILGLISTGAILIMDIQVSHLFIQIIVKCILWFVLFCLLLILFRVVTLTEITNIIKKNK